jgi:hypothetical protein
VDQNFDLQANRLWRGVSLPLLILVVALSLEAFSKGANIYGQWQSLAALKKNQDTQIQAATKLRSQLDTLARETAILANKGNSNARIVVEQLQKRGITIDIHAAPVQGIQ